MRKLELAAPYPSSLTNFFPVQIGIWKVGLHVCRVEKQEKFLGKNLGACENKQQTQPTYDPRSRIQMVYTPKRNTLYPYTTKKIYKIP